MHNIEAETKRKETRMTDPASHSENQKHEKKSESDKDEHAPPQMTTTPAKSNASLQTGREDFLCRLEQKQHQQEESQPTQANMERENTKNEERATTTPAKPSSQETTTETANDNNNASFLMNAWKTPNPKNLILCDSDHLGHRVGGDMDGLGGATGMADTLKFLNQSGVLDVSVAEALDPSSIKELRENYTPKPSTVKKLQRSLRRTTEKEKTPGDTAVGRGSNLTETAIKNAAAGRDAREADAANCAKLPPVLQPRLIQFDAVDVSVVFPASELLVDSNAASTSHGKSDDKSSNTFNLDADIRTALLRQSDDIAKLHSKLDRLTEVLEDVLLQQQRRPQEPRTGEKKQEDLETATALRRLLPEGFTRSETPATTTAATDSAIAPATGAQHTSAQVPLPPVERISLYLSFCSRLHRLKTFLIRNTLPGRLLATLMQRANDENIWRHLDVYLLLKMMIVVTIVGKRATSGASANRARQSVTQAAEDDSSVRFTWDYLWNLYRMHIFILLTLIAYMVQTGALQFLWRFIKDDEAWRRIIFGYGEEESDEPAPPVPDNMNVAEPRPPRRGQREAGRIAAGVEPAAGNAPAPGRAQIHAGEEAQPTFFTGAIAPPATPAVYAEVRRQQQRIQPRHFWMAIQDGVWDAVYLFGSFFLSLLPSWRPQQQERPRLTQHQPFPQDAQQPQPQDAQQPQPQDAPQLTPVDAPQPPRQATEADGTAAQTQVEPQGHDDRDSDRQSRMDAPQNMEKEKTAENYVAGNKGTASEEARRTQHDK
jgi:hypothetical protein